MPDLDVFGYSGRLFLQILEHKSIILSIGRSQTLELVNWVPGKGVGLHLQDTGKNRRVLFQ